MHNSANPTLSAHPLLRDVSVDRRPHEIHSQADLLAASTALLRDHSVFGVPVLPAAAYIDIAMAAAEQLNGQRGASLSDVVFHDLLAVPADESATLRVRARRLTATTTRFDIESAAPSAGGIAVWRRHAEGVVEHDLVTPPNAPPFGAGGEAPLDGSRQSRDEFYHRAARSPFRWGPTHRVVAWTARTASGMTCELQLADAVPNDQNWLHPTLIDGCLQAPALELSGDGASDRVALPARISRLHLAAAHPDCVTVNWRTTGTDAAAAMVVNLLVLDESANPAATMDGVAFRSLSRTAFQAVMAARAAQGSATPAAPAPGTELLARLKAAPSTERRTILADFIGQNVAELLKLKRPGPADLHRAFHSIGLDSLLAIELQFRLQKALGFTLPSGAGLTFDTIDGLGSHLLAHVIRIEP